MDGDGVERLARALATGALRRRVIAGLGFGLLAPGLGRGRAAACTKVGNACDRDADCRAGARCRNGECRCKGAYAECDGRCFELETDGRHCGAYGNACTEGETCCDADERCEMNLLNSRLRCRPR